MRWLPLLLFFAYVYIELTVFIQVADAIGLLGAIILVIITSLLGLSLMRHQGFRTMLVVQQKLRDGENPAAEMLKSVALVVSGILLLLPGFVTDIIGLLLLLPTLQKHLLFKMMPHMRFRRGDSPAGRTFEGEYQRKEENHLSDTSRQDDQWRDR